MKEIKVNIFTQNEENEIHSSEELENKIKSVRGKRREANLYEESAELPTYMGYFYPKSDENNMYLNQKERNVVRIQIEDVLHKFEGYVDDHLYKNELELAKADHNVVIGARSILSKLDVADTEEKYKVGAKVELLNNIGSIDKYDNHKSTIEKGTKGYVRNINYDKNEFEIFLESCVVLTCDIECFDKNFKVSE